MTTQQISRPLGTGTVALFAATGGVAVANLYWAQPILSEIAASFDVTASDAGLLVTVTQIGYAIGVLLIVPLGDRLDRRRLIPGALLVCAIALVAVALAPTFITVAIALPVVGLTTVTGPLLTPLAGDLADPVRRGRVIGTVASGMMVGVLASRTISGLLTDTLGWRSVYLAAAAAAVILAAVLARRIPPLPPRTSLRYLELLRSVFSTIRRHADVRTSLLAGGIGFGVLTLFWTALTFLLSAAPFSYPPAVIGLFGLAGLAGVLAAQGTGTFTDRGWARPAMSIALAGTIISLAIAGLAGGNVVVLLAAIVLLDIAARAIAVLSQTTLLAVDATARSRLTTAFVVSNFIGGAIGSTAAVLLWTIGGWSTVMIAGAIAAGLALTVWLATHPRTLDDRTAA